MNGTIMIEAVYDFIHTNSWRYWKYSELVDVALSAGNNTIKFFVANQNGGPNIDHLPIGKPPAIVMKSELVCKCLHCYLSLAIQLTLEHLLVIYVPPQPMVDHVLLPRTASIFSTVGRFCLPTKHMSHSLLIRMQNKATCIVMNCRQTRQVLGDWKRKLVTLHRVMALIVQTILITNTVPTLLF